MSRSVIVLGAGGMAGQAFCKYFNELGFDVLGVSRVGSDINLDLINQYDALDYLFQSFAPTFVVNCAALVSLKACEDNPILCYQINSLLPQKLSNSSVRHGFKFIHISTDHYYVLNNIPVLHSETDPIFLFNTYAKSKYLGELYSASCDKSLIIRTNITGFRNQPQRPTFIEWMIDSFQNPEPIKLFTDFYTSTIHVSAFCRYVYSLVEHGCSGLFNISSSESISKYQFASLLAKEMRVTQATFVQASVEGLYPKRCSDLGLDCTKAESILDVAMPSSQDVVRSLAKEYQYL